MKTFLANPTATVLYRYGNSLFHRFQGRGRGPSLFTRLLAPNAGTGIQGPGKGGSSRPRQAGVARVVFGLDHGTANEQETKQPRIRRTAHLQSRERVWGDGGAANGTEKLFTGSSDM